MIFNRSVSTRTVFFLSILLLLLQSMEVLAFGAREDPVVQAEELIEQNRFNDATLLLREVVRRQPERFDEVEALFRRIRMVRSRYNDLWQELIFILENEPDNVERAFAVISEMETIDEAPSIEALEEFQQWRDIVVLRFNLDQFEQVSSAASLAIQEERYVDALLTYREGLGLFREEFETLSYADELGPRAFAIERELASRSEELGVLAIDLQQAVEAYVAALTRDPRDEQTLMAVAEDLRLQLIDYVDAEMHLAALGAELRDLGRTAQTMRAMNDPDPYLTFTAWFAFGRTAAGGREGLFGAARAIALEQIATIFSAGPDDAEVRTELALSRTDEARYDEAGSVWRDVASGYEALDQILTALDDWDSFHAERVPDLNRATVDRRLEERAAFRFAETTARIVADMTDLRAALASGFDGSERDGTAWTTVEEQYRNAVEIRARVSEADEARAEAAGRADAMAIELEERLDRMVDDTAALDRSIARNFLDARRETFVSVLDDLRVRQESSEVIAFTGVPQETPDEVPALVDTPPDDDGDDLLLYRYPDIAASRMEAVLEELMQLLEEVDAARGRFEAANEPVRSDPEVAAIDQAMAELRGSLVALQDRSRTAQADAESRFAESQELQDEVVATLDDAETLVTDNPDAAQDLFDLASDLLVESLDLRQDPGFRSAMDTRLAALGAEIQEARFRIIVVEVRDLIEEGRSLYRQDSFGDAESVLLEARERWNSVNDEENPEVQFWLRLTQSALNLQGDRDLSEADPLFRPLAGFLSLAFDAFERAQEARREGNMEQSSQLLGRAEQNIQAVVSARPFNQEARVLSLRITQLTNPDEFPEIFTQRYQQALALAESDVLAALNDLYDLQEINPDYPGINASIERLEIEAGIRERPVDQAALNRSAQLVTQARQTWQPGDRASAERAQALLEEAIQLSPENRNAIALLDDGRLDLGSTAAATLSTSGLQQLRQAENLFLDGSIGRAIVIVERLWQEEDNRRFPPLQDLRNRLLGQ